MRQSKSCSAPLKTLVRIFGISKTIIYPRDDVEDVGGRLVRLHEGQSMIGTIKNEFCVVGYPRNDLIDEKNRWSKSTNSARRCLTWQIGQGEAYLARPVRRGLGSLKCLPETFLTRFLAPYWSPTFFSAFPQRALMRSIDWCQFYLSALSRSDSRGNQSSEESLTTETFSGCFSTWWQPILDL